MFPLSPLNLKEYVMRINGRINLLFQLRLSAPNPIRFTPNQPLISVASIRTKRDLFKYHIFFS